MYDIIGDIHGHATELHQLLENLGYQNSAGVYSHPSRRPLFVGDFIDRGPQILETLQTVRWMCDAGNALAVMGNHEFNALAYHTPASAEPGKYLRDHNPKNQLQHSATLAQLNDDALDDFLDRFRTLPMWLDLDGLRVVHACWDMAQIEVILATKERLDGVSTEFMTEATDQSTELFAAVEVVLKGKEADLPAGHYFVDKDGHERKRVRTKWFLQPFGLDYAKFSLPENPSLAEQSLPDSVVDSAKPYGLNEPPVFFGHYWLKGEPSRLAENVACVDYSVAKQGKLVANRWDGERELEDEKFVAVTAG